MGNPKLETTLSYIVACILFVYMAEGISSITLLNSHLANVQVVIFVLLLIAIAFFTAEQERNLPRFPLPRKLTTSSFDRRKKIPIASLAVGAQFLGSMFRALEMVLGGGHSGYQGDMSRCEFSMNAWLDTGACKLPNHNLISFRFLLLISVLFIRVLPAWQCAT